MDDATTKQFDWGPSEKLFAMLVKQLSSELPNLCLASLAPRYSIGHFHRFADYVGRGLHLLLLDSRDMQPAVQIDQAVSELTSLQHKLEAEGKTNFTSISNAAYLHSALKRQENLVEQRKRGVQDDTLQGWWRRRPPASAGLAGGRGGAPADSRAREDAEPSEWGRRA